MTSSRRRSLHLAATMAALLIAGCTAERPVARPDVTASTVLPSASAVLTSQSVERPEVSTNLPTATGTAGAPEAPSVPAVASLIWLDGRSEAAGITIGMATGQRWQGPTAGEYALIGADGAYQWFGADGSAVACVADDKCVGYDAAGFIAITQPNGVRQVYGSDHVGVGNFRADGSAAPGTPTTFDDALAASGVDLAALLDVASRGVPFAGGVTGDPHVITGGGKRYSTQLMGDFVARSGDRDHTVHLRLEPLPHQGGVSIVTALALRTADAVLVYRADGTLKVDGQLVTPPETFRQVPIPGGPEIGVWAADGNRTTRLVIVWADGSTITAAAHPDLGMTVTSFLPSMPGIGGLFGSGSAAAATDLLDRQNLPSSAESTIGDWRVRPGEEVFADELALDPDFPGRAVEVPEAARPFAERSCREAGVVTPEDLQACTFDVGLTGDDGFALGHGALAASARRRVPEPIERTWTALALSESIPAQQLPSILDTKLSARSELVYDVPIVDRGAVRIEFVSGCTNRASVYPGDREAAARLFDPAGRAVSARVPLCGTYSTGVVNPGVYKLQLAGDSVADVDVRVQVVTP